MGQDQSSPLAGRTSLPPSQSSSSTTQSKSISQSASPTQKQQDLENCSVDEEEEDIGEEPHEGIIQVVEGPSVEEEDEELRLLRSVKRFDPFIKEQNKGFSLDGLLGLKQSKPSSSSRSENDVLISSATDIFLEIQSHIKDQMKHVNNEQRILLRRTAHVDELSSHTFKTVSSAFTQAKLASEKVAEAAIIKEQAAKAQEYAINIFKSLTLLEKHLDPEDRIQTIEDSRTKWPELNQLRARASKSSHPPFEKLLKSSTTNDITTIGTSTSTLLEKVVVNGEPALPVHEPNSLLSSGDSPMNQTGTSSTSTSSLALSRLRGLSSRSIRNLYTELDD